MDRYLLDLGRWYIIDIGNSYSKKLVKAKLIENTDEGAIMKYREKEHHTFRSKNIVPYRMILCECKRPSIFGDL